MEETGGSGPHGVEVPMGTSTEPQIEAPEVEIITPPGEKGKKLFLEPCSSSLFWITDLDFSISNAGIPTVTDDDWILVEDQEEGASDDGEVDYGDGDDDDDDYNALHQSEFADPEHLDIPGLEMEIPQSSTPPGKFQPWLESYLAKATSDPRLFAVTPSTAAMAEGERANEVMEPSPAQEAPVSEAASFHFQVVDIPVSTPESPLQASGESVQME